MKLFHWTNFLSKHNIYTIYLNVLLQNTKSGVSQSFHIKLKKINCMITDDPWPVQPSVCYTCPLAAVHRNTRVSCVIISSALCNQLLLLLAH